MSSMINDRIKDFCTNPPTNVIPYVTTKNNKSRTFLSLNFSAEDHKILFDYLNRYSQYLNACIEENTQLNWEDESIEACYYFKELLADEHDFFQGIRSLERTNSQRFVEGNYSLRFFVLMLPISGSCSIHLYQKITGGSNANIKKTYVDFIRGTQRIQIFDPSSLFQVGDAFDFCVHYDSTNPSNCFALIHKRELYEKLFDYIERYKEAFDILSSYDYMDFSYLDRGSEHVWRKCYSLLRFPRLKECLDKFFGELNSEEYTLSKKALTSKKIPYVMINGRPVVKPQNLRQASEVIKILRDGLVRTNFLDRIGIVGYVDEV